MKAGRSFPNFAREPLKNTGKISHGSEFRNLPWRARCAGNSSRRRRFYERVMFDASGKPTPDSRADISKPSSKVTQHSACLNRMGTLKPWRDDRRNCFVQPFYGRCALTGRARENRETAGSRARMQPATSSPACTPDASGTPSCFLVPPPPRTVRNSPTTSAARVSRRSPLHLRPFASAPGWQRSFERRKRR